MSDLTLGQAIRDLARRLERVRIETPQREARLIAAHALNMTMARLSVSENDLLDEGEVHALNLAVAPRLERRPLSHVLGRRAFYKHEFHVGPDVLDPRPDTETLIRAALERRFERLLDLGTGSGAILLSLLAERPLAQGVGTDLSCAALDVARANTKRLGLTGRVDLIQSDWFAEVTGTYDLIVSNPPYIALDEMETLAPELAFEPRMALTDESDGLSAYRVICSQAGAYLKAGGALMVEIGPTQGAAVAELMQAANLCEIRILPDLDGRDRVVCGGMRGMENGVSLPQSA
ncbi:peptide chain release factor N(5)-glutamine methyltransferase [Roseovarius aestuarii]|nr:peptide chain release factor N(5)-glutamine methyltransferase [Roseovarius aestuarii]